MAAAADRDRRSPRRSDRIAAKILRAVAKAPLHIFLVVVARALARADDRALHHVDPARLRSSRSQGWWQIFSHPSLATLSNYDALFHNAGPDRRR